MNPKRVMLFLIVSPAWRFGFLGHFRISRSGIYSILCLINFTFRPRRCSGDAYEGGAEKTQIITEASENVADESNGGSAWALKQWNFLSFSCHSWAQRNLCNRLLRALVWRSVEGLLYFR